MMFYYTYKLFSGTGYFNSTVNKGHPVKRAHDKRAQT